MLSLVFSVPNVSGAESREVRLDGRVQYYFDSRDFNTLNITNRLSGLPFRSQVFGYTNFQSRQGESSGRFDIRETSSEYRLTTESLGEVIGVPRAGIFGEVNYGSPGRRSVGRFGPAYRFHYANPFFDGVRKGWVRTRIAVLETDGEGQQLSLSYGIPVIPRFHLSGFTDYNLRPGEVDRWISEVQFNLRLLGILSLVLEFRHNGFFAESSSKETTGWAPGIRVDYQF